MEYVGSHIATGGMILLLLLCSAKAPLMLLSLPEDGWSSRISFRPPAPDEPSDGRALRVR
jgi:hypothetical protein